MRKILSEQEFNIHYSVVSTLVDRSKHIPEQIFNENFKYFLFITFDEMLMPLFFDHLKQYTKSINQAEFWFAVLDPDPISYFYHHFGRYNVFIFDQLDDNATFMSQLNDFPNDSPADAAMHNSNSILVSSNNSKWAVYGDRSLEIGICAFVDEESMHRFKSIYDGDLLDGVDSATEFAFGAQRNDLLKKKFRSNYSDKRPA